MKNKYYDFVPEREYKPYLKRAYNLVEKVVSNLKHKGIASKCYLIGSAGKRHLVTRLIINGEKKPFDVDINIELDIDRLQEQYRNLNYLKEIIRAELNKSISSEEEYFSDGENSTSVISVPLHFIDDQTKTMFSFDIGIVSRNKNGNLQRLLYNKKQNLYTWCKVRNSSEIDKKVKEIKIQQKWNSLRAEYLKIKNMYINDFNYSSFVCFKIAVENVYKTLKNN
ncbi:MAG: hypothetical protein UIB61_11565 [Treponema sp.]|nr:hypothetical protein [Treponema sp.]